MAHVLDPGRIASPAQYCAALDELSDLLLEDPDTPSGQRVHELIAMIEQYEATHDEVPRWPPSSTLLRSSRVRDDALGTRSFTRAATTQR